MFFYINQNRGSSDSSSDSDSDSEDDLQSWINQRRKARLAATAGIQQAKNGDKQRKEEAKLQVTDENKNVNTIAERYENLKVHNCLTVILGSLFVCLFFIWQCQQENN